MAGKQIHPPVAAVRPHAITQHGETRVDNYFWLRDKENPEVREYLEAENAWTAEQMRDTEPLQERLYREIVGRIQETDTSAPERSGGWLYYSRTVAGQQYRIYCRKRAGSGCLENASERSRDREGAVVSGIDRALCSPPVAGEQAHDASPLRVNDPPAADNDGEEILLDANRAAEGFAYFQLGVFAPSPDHTLLAYSIDTEGDEDFTVFFQGPAHRGVAAGSH
jgi:oligopeptidase B